MTFAPEMAGEGRGEGPDQQHVVRLFHDQSGRSNRMVDAFDRGDGSSFELGSLHDGGVHSLHSV